MQQTNQLKQQKSRCTYCSSADYGKGCRFGPHGVHFHPNSAAKCCYCGSASFGRGCKLNPTSDIHVHGIHYNSMFKESIQSFLEHKVFVHELKKNFTDFQAYKLEIIDENGNKLREPITEAERVAFSPMVKTIIRLKKFLGPKLDLMEAALIMESVNDEQEDIERYKKIVDYRERINDVIEEVYELLDEAHADGLQVEDIHRILKA